VMSRTGGFYSLRAGRHVRDAQGVILPLTDDVPARAHLAVASRVYITHARTSDNLCGALR